MNTEIVTKALVFCALALTLMVLVPLASSAATSADLAIQVKSSLSMYKDVQVDATSDGMVMLTGMVQNEAEKNDAGKRAREVAGVKSVDNKLRLSSGESGSVGKYIDDTTITAEVKAKILGQKGLDSLDISVETVQGVVTLTGEVDNQTQIALAERTAAEVESARKIDNRLTVKKM